MQFCLKSSEYNEEELIRNFNRNFETSILKELEYSKFKIGITGTIKEIHINNVFILFQKYDNQNSENHTLQIIQNSPVFLLQFVIEGEVSFSLRESTSIEYNLSKNMYNLFYIPASEYIFHYSQHKRHILNIFFTESFLEKKMEAYFLKDSKKYQQAKKFNNFYSFFNKGLIFNSEIHHIINEFINCPFKGLSKQSYLESKLTELILIALTATNSTSTNSIIRKEDVESLTKVENYIRSHLKDDLNIEKLSVLAGFNTSKFKSIFKQVYGIPVFKYITTLRIEKAIQLISKHDYNISQASFEVGYKNPQHFTVAFKKKLGYLPSQLINRKAK